MSDLSKKNYLKKATTISVYILIVCQAYQTFPYFFSYLDCNLYGTRAAPQRYLTKNLF